MEIGGRQIAIDEIKDDRSSDAESHECGKDRERFCQASPEEPQQEEDVAAKASRQRKRSNSVTCIFRAPSGRPSAVGIIGESSLVYRHQIAAGRRWIRIAPAAKLVRVLRGWVGTVACRAKALANPNSQQ